MQDDFPLVSPDPASPADWSAKAVEDNLDLMASLYTEEAARKQVAIYRGRYLPTLNVVGSYGRDTSHSVVGEDALTDVIGLSLNWNLIAGGLVASEVRQAQATYLQAHSQYELTRRTVNQNARNDFEGVISGIAGIKANRQAVLSNQTSVEATTIGLKVGTRTELDVLIARQNLAAAQKAFYISRYNYLNSMLALKQDAGSLNEADMAKVDSVLVDTFAPADEPGPDRPGCFKLLGFASGFRDSAGRDG